MTGTFLALALLASQDPPAFRDATRESGLQEILDRHFAAHPKWWLSGMTLVDLDGDGDLDLHLGSHGGGPAAAAENDGKGRFTYVDPKVEIPRGLEHRQDLPYPGGEIRLAYDFDEDGKLDLNVSWHDGGGSMYFNKGGFSFRRAPFLGDARHDLRVESVADLNRDGIADYLMSGHSAGSDLAVYFGKGDGTFGPEPGLKVPLGIKEAGAIPVDVDGDGDLDLLSRQGGYQAAGRRLFRNDGNGKFVNATVESGLTEDGGDVHGVGDVNQDGALDLVCIEGRGVEIYLNDGKGRFARKAGAVRGFEKAPNKPHQGYGANWGGAVVTDFDNDGVPDLILNGRFYLHLFRGTGGGGFDAASEGWRLPTQATSAVDEGLCFGDVDGDGRLDLVACTPARESRKQAGLFRNELPARKGLRVRLVGKKGNRGAAGAKIRVGDAGGILAFEQVAVWGRQSFHSFYAAAATERHYGLGAREKVDVTVEFYPSGVRVERRGVPAGGVLLVEEEKP